MKQVLKEFEISWFMLENLIINNYFIKTEFIKKKFTFYVTITSLPNF